MSKVFSVKGMSCGHCVESVENSLNEITGVKDVKVDLKGGKVTVSFDESVVEISQLTNAIEDAGYDVVA